MEAFDVVVRVVSPGLVANLDVLPVAGPEPSEEWTKRWHASCNQG